jgi:hypothetical protein
VARLAHTPKNQSLLLLFFRKEDLSFMSRVAGLMGHVDTVTPSRITGWAADPARPDAALEVIIRLNDRRARVTADRMRPDLVAAFAGATGRYGFVLDGGPLPLSPFVRTEVEVVFAEGGAPVPGGRAVVGPAGSGAPAPDRAGRPAPLVVTTMGRTGSSLLMARLARHPAILVARGHPYEMKLLSYYAAALRTLLAEADTERSTRPDTMVAAEQRFFVGSNPFNPGVDARDDVMAGFWMLDAPARLRACFAGMLDDYYGRVAEASGKAGARYFAEKIGTSDLVREAAAYLFGPVCEIVLVRDPRDLICSAGAFWGRGFADSVTALKGAFARVTRPRREPGLRQMLVRYEDLIARPEAVMAAMCGFLGVGEAALAPDGAAEAAVFARHGTVRVLEETVGRWRRELDGAQVAVAEREFGAVLARYGYV